MPRPSTISKDFWKLLSVVSDIAMDTTEDSSDEWKNFEPKEMEECSWYSFWEALPADAYPMYKSYAKGYAQCFRAINHFVKRKKVPTSDEIQAAIFGGVNWSYDMRYHNHFIQKGGHTDYAMKALFDYAIDAMDEMVDLMDDVKSKKAFLRKLTREEDSAREVWLANCTTTCNTAAPGAGCNLNYSTDGWQRWPEVESGDWGLVYISSGAFRGKFGYYDDEEDEDEAVVYFGPPLLSDCYTLSLASLRKPPFQGEFTAM